MSAASAGLAIVEPLLIVALAPGVAGLIARLSSWALGGRGPSVLQPYAELQRASRRLQSSAVELERPLAAVALLAAVGAATECPLLSLRGARDPRDIVLLAGLLALSRLAAHAVGLMGDPGERLRVSRARIGGLAAEPALLLALLILERGDGSAFPPAARLLALAAGVLVALIQSAPFRPAARTVSPPATAPPAGIAGAGLALAAQVRLLTTWLAVLGFAYPLLPIPPSGATRVAAEAGALALKLLFPAIFVAFLSRTRFTARLARPRDLQVTALALSVLALLLGGAGT